MAIDDLEKGVGCQLSGSFDIDTVSGNFHISFHSFGNEFMKIRDQNINLFEKINMSYKIETLKFGNNQETVKTEEIKKIINDLDLEEKLFENFVDHERNHYEKFIAGFFLEIFPYTLIDHRTNFVYKSLQHSFNRKIKAF